MVELEEILSIQILLDGYQIQEEISSNDLRVMYRVSHPDIGNCALKYLDRSVTAEQDFWQPFSQQLQKIYKIDHPNLAKIHKVESNSHTFFLRELVLGESLSSKLEKSALAFDEATSIVLDVAMAILAGYPFGLVYNNLKPSNIIIAANGTCKLVDVCLPPIDPRYLSLEQWKKEKSQTPSDIYTLGLIYYHMLRGECLFDGETSAEIMEQNLYMELNLEHFLSHVPSQIQDILGIMLAKDVNQRYRSPVPLIAALREAMKELQREIRPVVAPTVSGEVSRSKTPRRRSNQHTSMFAHKKGKITRKHPSSITTKLIRSTDFEPLKEDEEEDVEEVYLSNLSLEEDPERALKRITHIDPVIDRKEAMRPRRVHFPKKHERVVIEHLQKTFRRECWLLKEADVAAEMEVNIDIDQAYVLQHYFCYEDLLQGVLNRREVEEQRSIEEVASRAKEQTVDYNQEEWAAESKAKEKSLHSETEASEMIEAINDINISTVAMEIEFKNHQPYIAKTYEGEQLDVKVDFANAYQTMGWVKFVRQHELKRGEQFELKEGESDANPKKIFTIFLDKLEQYHKAHQNIAGIKQFFQGDYEISELDKGGMGVVLKLTAKNDPTILSLRAENYWARQRYASCLRIIKDEERKRESIYAELPKGTEFVVKVAFEGYEEALIQEARILSSVAEDLHICQTIIGSVQQGRMFASDESEDHKRIGYYLLLEYASQGNSQQLLRRFPDRRLSLTVAFAMMYGMVQTLQRLEEKGIIHRDIKPKNILLDINGVPKLSDFGLAITTTQASGKLTEERRRLLRVIDAEFLHITREIEQYQTLLDKLKKRKITTQFNALSEQEREKRIAQVEREIARLQGEEQARADALKERYRPISAEENANKGRFAGSIHYAAPEQFDTEALLTPACDVYQLGAVMFSMLTGRRPVQGKSSVDIMSQILYPVKAKVTDFIESTPTLRKMSDLITKMMAHKPEERITVDEIRDEMDQILFNDALELRQPPTYEEPEFDSPKQRERWQRKVEFAQKIHKNCVEVIFSTIFQNQPLPELREDIKKIVFFCPKCGKKLHVYKHMNGKKGSCPKCKKRILVQIQWDEQE